MCNRAIGAHFLIKGGLCLVTALLYWNTASAYFLGDDLSFLYHVADQVRRGQLVSEWLKELITPPPRGGCFYRPLTDLSFSIDYLLWGTNPAGWHLMNPLLHLVKLLLLWRLIERVARGTSDRANIVVGGAAAAIFALRPSAPETVA